MGTRHLTAVYMDGDYRVAQYGQWDGYPEGAGISCLHFVRDKMKETVFKHKIGKLHWLDDEKYNELMRRFGADPDGFIQVNDHDRLRRIFPELHRDTGSDILQMIQDGKVLSGCLRNDITFAADSLFCEWAWVIDLDKRMFEAYKGFNKVPLTEADRFYPMREHEDAGEYHGVKLVAAWSLDELPTDEEFLAAFKTEEE